MSEKTPYNDPFADGGDLREEELSFPGAERDDLTEEEKLFTFDADYLDGDFPRADTTPEKPESSRDRAARVDALASALRSRQTSERREKQERSSKIDAVFNAFQKRANGATEKKSAEEQVLSALKRREKTDAKPARQDSGGAAPNPSGLTARPKAGRLSARSRRAEANVVRDPVTVGKDLRSDQMLVYDSELDEVDYTDDDDLPEVRDYLPIRFRRYGRVGVAGGILYALFVISVSIVLACAAWLFASDVLALNKEPKSAIVTIDEYEPGEEDPVYSVIDDEEVPIQVDIDQVAAALKDAGMIEYKWLFKLFSQFAHAETKIDPGTYDVSTELDYRALVTALQFGSGNQEITRVTFPEGYSMEQIFALLEENHIAHSAELYDAAANYDFDYDFLEDVPLGDAGRLEGFLFPDTYDFYQGEDAAVAINRFLRNMDDKLTDDILSAASSRGLSVHDLITVASLIEKEAGSDEERGLMASVIYNRLNAGMPLQLDSTLNYIKGTSTFALTTEDTEIDDPYNTYLYEGLPPGPICNPGLASIQAAAEPESTDYWYWYSVDGVSTFFTEYDDFINFQNANPVN